MFDTYQQIFEQRADAYHRAMTRWPQARQAEFEMVLAPLPLRQGDVLADLPAGGGYLRQYLPQSIDYVAVDPSRPFFELCSESASARRLHCELSAVPLPQASVDKLVSLAGLHHVDNLDAVFAEMRRLLRPQGWLVLADVDCSSASAEFLNGFVDRTNPMGHRGVFFDEFTLDRLRDSGFEPVLDERVNCNWRFADHEDVGAFCSALFGIERVSRQEVVAEIDARFGLRAAADGSEVAFDWPLRRIVCRPAATA